MKIVNALVLSQDKFLTVKRGKEPWKGMYDLPGDHVEESETEIEALKRELKEETGFLIAVDESNYLGTWSIKQDLNEVSIYMAKIVGGHECQQAEEVEEIEWLTLEEFVENLKEQDFPEEGVQILREVIPKVIR
ncbi:MAG: NUDIX domain-containing protein [Nanoarchaeota archaeon]